MDTIPQRVTEAPVEGVPIDQIRVGVRRRQALGPLEALCRSIVARGLIHPILIRGDGELVSGARRLEVCRRLRWATIPARRVDGLSDDELRALEFHENVERLALLDYEASAERLAALRQEEVTGRGAAERAGISVQDLDRPGRGRPRGAQAGSLRAVAAAGGVSKGTVHHLTRRVTLAERFPFLRRRGWSQTAALEAGATLDTFPVDEHEDLGRLLNQPGVPPRDALGILGALTRRSPEDRRAIYAMARSPDAHVRANALARAAKLPPNPDPGYLLLIDIERTLRQAAKQCRVPELATAIRTLADQAHALIASWQKEITHADAP
jgi:hypothetical protein